jgi:hypothetical protein
MNTPYDLTESSILIAKLLQLTRDGKIEWAEKRSAVLPEMARFQTTIDEDLEALVWSTNKEAGFRILEKEPVPRNARRRWEGGDPLGNPPLNVAADSEPLPFISGRDLVAISVDHGIGPSRGEIYVNLISLLELARRASDKVEPKIDRIKHYLDKLAV